MMGIINFEVFLLTAIMLNITPGTDTMYIISRSVSQGSLAGVYSALGITVGSVIHTMLAAFGLSIILMQSAFLFNIIKVIGAIYLAYLGIKMLQNKNPNKKQELLPMLDHKKIFLQGILTNVLNPKVALFFLAFLPQFIQVHPSGVNPLPFMILGLTFTITGGIWCTVVAVFSSIATNKLRGNSKAGSLLNKLTGIVFITMGIKLLQTKSA
ncbi:LysE family translocator [Bacillus sp. BGMRC 2118]|nr:LysE family translocator [Bacillus sp. BGMRC 2118]